MQQGDEMKDFSAILEPTDTGVKFESEFYNQATTIPVQSIVKGIGTVWDWRCSWQCRTLAVRRSTFCYTTT